MENGELNIENGENTPTQSMGISLELLPLFFKDHYRYYVVSFLVGS